MNPTIELIRSHRSIRKFTDRKIPRELLVELVPMRITLSPASRASG